MLQSVGREYMWVRIRMGGGIDEIVDEREFCILETEGVHDWLPVLCVHFRWRSQLLYHRRYSFAFLRFAGRWTAYNALGWPAAGNLSAIVAFFK